jgi:hypothetical protein
VASRYELSLGGIWRRDLRRRAVRKELDALVPLPWNEFVVTLNKDNERRHDLAAEPSREQTVA